MFTIAPSIPSFLQATTMMVGASRAAATSAVDVGLSTLSIRSPVKVFMAPSIRIRS